MVTTYGYDSQAFVPWKEPVTYTAVRAGVTVSVDCEAGCYPSPVRESSDADGVALAQLASFTLPLPLGDGYGIEPYPGDEVSWDGRLYTVTETVASYVLRFWRVTGTRVIHRESVN